MSNKGKIASIIKIELVKLLYQQIKFALWAESLAALCLTIVLWHTSLNHTLIATWLAFNLLICGLSRHILVLSYQHSTAKIDLTKQQARFWLRLFFIGALLSGISWGMVGSLLMVKDNLLGETFIIFLLLGITAAANPIYSPNKFIYLSFLLPAFAPLMIWFFVQGNIYMLLGILSFVYICLMFITSYYSNRLISSSLRLRFENMELVDDLSRIMLSLEHRTRDLEKSLSLVRATIESTTDGVLVLSAHNKVEDYNRKFVEMWGIPQSIFSQKRINNITDFLYPQLVDPVNFVNKFHSFSENSSEESYDEILLKDGRIFERYSRPQSIGNNCVGRVWSFRDVTGRKYMEAKLFHQANFDFTTGLPNRSLSLDRISQAIAYAKRSFSSIAILFLDLDKFKMINDTLGHTFGDKLLKAVAERLAGCIREDDTVSRSGGDEFLIILTSLRSENEVIAIARKCLAIMNESFVIDAHTFNLTISIGISFYPRDGEEAETLIRNADIAMYRAKELGRNNFQFYTDEMNQKVLARINIENYLREAIRNWQKFYLLYQPIVSLTTGAITGVEALLRWEHPTLGNMSPDEFIPVAEDSGLIVPISEWVLRCACTQVKEWHRKGFMLQVSVNVSVVQFKQLNTFNKIMKILDETGLDPHYLALELTESIIMEDVEANIPILNKMKEKGISIVIDDFGVGYSSLNYLKQLPVDKVKIDRSFVQDIPQHSDAAAITSAIVALANRLNLRVIAEGVEKEDQLNFLVKNHCDEIQGFYYSEPLSVEGVTKLLEEKKVLDLPH